MYLLPWFFQQDYTIQYWLEIQTLVVMIFRCSSTLRLLPTPLRIIPSEFSQTKDLQRIKQAGWNMHNCLLQFMPCTIFTEESFTAFLWFGAHQGGYNSSQVAYRNNIKHTHKVRSKWDVKPFKTIMDLKLKLILVKRDSIFLSLFLWFFFFLKCWFSYRYDVSWCFGRLEMVFIHEGT